MDPALPKVGVEGCAHFSEGSAAALLRVIGSWLRDR